MESAGIGCSDLHLAYNDHLLVGQVSLPGSIPPPVQDRADERRFLQVNTNIRCINSYL